MKYLLIILCVLTASCSNQKKEPEYIKIRVSYNSGNIDTLNVERSTKFNLRLEDGCVYQGWSGIACYVKKYEVIE